MVTSEMFSINPLFVTIKYLVELSIVLVGHLPVLCIYCASQIATD